MTDEQTPEAPPPPPPPPPAAAPPPPPSGAASSNRGLMVVLSYLWLLALVPLIMEKEDAEVQWHAKHGLVLFGAEFFLFIALTVIGTVGSVIGLGCLVALVMPLAWLGALVLHVVCIAKGLKGERFLIPGLSDYASKF